MNNYDKIITAALKLFVHEGFHGSSTAKIAAEAGVSNGTFFHYFKTKEELINSLYTGLKESFKNHLLENLGDFQNSKSKIRQIWFSYANWMLDNGEISMFFNMYSNSPYIDKLSREEASRNFSFIYEAFREGAENEMLLNIHPCLLLYSMYGAIESYTRFINDFDMPRDEYIEPAFSMWWRSVVNA